MSEINSPFKSHPRTFGVADMMVAGCWGSWLCDVEAEYRGPYCTVPEEPRTPREMEEEEGLNRIE
ncbi:hypothetical protein N7462_003796 [Penicillium macrosclerotiorum]|uniref:uncharacterized protein n=1 Tax=Penicillium macrosclerotiorum TaxID=303699 RepID=UPI002547240E|nr:uncharacterized protein N7462_003796 [Penicillium macrosclerotiorum]KAJ5689404.1 hypothetical protein N7462_003796 [Penicillium macrosclerotiorum]